MSETGFECPSCGQEFESEFPFGDDVTCPHCKATLLTDWDYVDLDTMVCWVTGVVHKGDVQKKLCR